MKWCNRKTHGKSHIDQVFYILYLRVFEQNYNKDWNEHNTRDYSILNCNNINSHNDRLY